MNVVLVNGYTEIRSRNSGGVTVLPCGCAHNERRWQQLCAADFEDWSARHDQAACDHLVDSPT